MRKIGRTLWRAHSIVVLTGAGVSVQSGIPVRDGARIHEGVTC